ncbi:MAG: DUF5696 domain-containing protein [Oscillospiraceae bacterium]|nr:DUF5696 domain-containing protein [Oscillospiraceae bacterium]
MSKRFKKLSAVFFALAVMLPVIAAAVYSDEEAESYDSLPEDDEIVTIAQGELRTNREALGLMSLAAENDKLALYFCGDDFYPPPPPERADYEDDISYQSSQDRYERDARRRVNDGHGVTLALLDKSTQEIWWANPVNAAHSLGTGVLRDELKSGLTLVYGELSARRTTTTHSSNSRARCSIKYKEIEKGIEITYTFNVEQNGNRNITIPVSYTLEDDHLKLHLSCENITEDDRDKIVTNLSFLTSFGAAGADEEGSFVIPDGGGALINFNNGKHGYRSYSGKVYGRDITTVRTTKPPTTQNVSLPMYGIIKGGAGMMVVADKGDSVASINAYVSMQNRTSYNSCYFDFELRTTDEYLLGGEANPLRVFEKRGILIPEIEVRYYPVSRDDKAELSFVDIASKYRDYLIGEKGLARSDSVNKTPLYIDFYGGVMRSRSVLGVPVRLQQKATGFDDAREILTLLTDLGADDMVVNYNDWTAADIRERVSDKATPAGILGGKRGWNRFQTYAEENGVEVYPAVDNLTFRNGGGYFTVFHTAIRVSNAYSRQIEYDLAHKIENKFYRPISLISPSQYGKIFDNIKGSYTANGISGFSMGSASSVIYGDYGRRAISRETAKQYIEEGYKSLSGSGTVFAVNANAYVLPYVDHVAKIPLSSGRFDLFDEDIPFYQAVLHGYKSYSTTPVNGDAQVAEFVLRGIAAGSNPHFDMHAVTADKLKDSLYDKLFYAEYEHWVEEAAGCSEFASLVLSSVSSEIITDYKALEDDTIETTYGNGVVITVDLKDYTAMVTKGEAYEIFKLADYVGGGIS